QFQPNGPVPAPGAEDVKWRDANLGRRTLQEGLAAPDLVKRANLAAHSRAAWAQGLLDSDLAQGGEQGFLRPAAWADELFDHAPARLQFSRWAQQPPGLRQELADRQVCRPLLQGDPLLQRVVTVTLLLALVFHHVRVHAQAVHDPATT